MTAFSGYRFLLGPEQLTFDRGRRRVSSPEQYRAWHLSMLLGRGADLWDSLEPTTAYINQGRWVAKCVWCTTGMLTRPDWGVAYCAECGARYWRVVFPADYEAATAILLSRVRRDQQNWDATQTVKELAEENKLPEVITP